MLIFRFIKQKRLFSLPETLFFKKATVSLRPRPLKYPVGPDWSAQTCLSQQSKQQQRRFSKPN